MSEIANALGVGPKFEFEGQTYTVGPRDFEVEAEMERVLEEQDYKTIERYAGVLGPAETQRQKTDWRRSVTSKVWSFGSPDFVRYYMSFPGMCKQAFLQLAKHNPHATEGMIDRVAKDGPKWEELWDKIAQSNADPLTPGSTTTSP